MKSEAGCWPGTAPRTVAGVAFCACAYARSCASVGTTTEGGTGAAGSGAASAARPVTIKPAVPAAAPLKKSRRPTACSPGRSLESSTDPSWPLHHTARRRNRESASESERDRPFAHDQVRAGDLDRAIALERRRVVAVERYERTEVRRAVEVLDLERRAVQCVSRRALVAVSTDSDAAVVAKRQRVLLGIRNGDRRTAGTLDRLELPGHVL